MGLHVGSLCEPERAAGGYDPQVCFNYGLRFDAATVALVGATARDEVTQAAVVRPSEIRLAVLDDDIRRREP